MSDDEQYNHLGVSGRILSTLYIMATLSRAKHLYTNLYWDILAISIIQEELVFISYAKRKKDVSELDIQVSEMWKRKGIFKLVAVIDFQMCKSN